MYAWHSGMWSAFYQAASSGLVYSWEDLKTEALSMDDPKERDKLILYFSIQSKKQNPVFSDSLASYDCLPWFTKR